MKFGGEAEGRSTAEALQIKIGRITILPEDSSQVVLLKFVL